MTEHDDWNVHVIATMCSSSNFILFTKANVPTGESPNKDINYSTHV